MKQLRIRVMAVCAMLGSLGLPSRSAADLKQLAPPGLKPPDTLRPAHPRQSGLASWYGRVLHGHHTASGERFDMFKFTAAHASLPLGTRLRVTNLRTSRSVVVRINDRGVLDTPGLALDLSFAAAKQLKMIRRGLDPISFEVLEPTPAMASLRTGTR